MRKLFRYLVWLLLALLVLLPALALAQTGGGYDLTWSTIDGGGYTFSTGGSYSSLHQFRGNDSGFAVPVGEYELDQRPGRFCRGRWVGRRPGGERNASQ